MVVLLSQQITSVQPSASQIQGTNSRQSVGSAKLFDTALVNAASRGSRRTSTATPTKATRPRTFPEGIVDYDVKRPRLDDSVSRDPEQGETEEEDELEAYLKAEIEECF